MQYATSDDYTPATGKPVFGDTDNNHCIARGYNASSYVTLTFAHAATEIGSPRCGAMRHDLTLWCSARCVHSFIRGGARWMRHTFLRHAMVSSAPIFARARNASYGGNAGAEIITSYILAVIVYTEISEKFQDIHGSRYQKKLKMKVFHFAHIQY